MVDLLFIEDRAALTKKGVIRTLYDPACGTGGMLSMAEDYLGKLNPSATLKTYGQELNPESYAICKGDMLITGDDATNVKFGNRFTRTDRPAQIRLFAFQSALRRGVEEGEEGIRDEHDKLGMGGRFGRVASRQRWLVAVPSAHDGEVQEDGNGSRLAIVFNGLPSSPVSAVAAKVRFAAG